MVEWGGLENRCASNSTQGSNPCLSASTFKINALDISFRWWYTKVSHYHADLFLFDAIPA